MGESCGEIENSYATGNVSSNKNAGGLVGLNYYLIENSYATGNVLSNGNATEFVENNPAENYYPIENFFGISNAGGLVGFNYYGIVENCYATGYISSNGNAGGFVGQNLDGMIIACYFDTDTTGTTYGGFDNTTNEDAADITGLTTSEMKKMAVFEGSGWDISVSDGHETVWGLYLKDGDTDGTLPGYGYPYIKTINNDVLIVPDSTGKTHDGNPAPTSIGYTIISDNPAVDAAKAVIGTLGYADLEGNPISPPTNAGTYGIIQNTLNSPYYQISVKDGATYTIDGAASNNRPSSSGTGSGAGTGSAVVSNSVPPSGTDIPAAGSMTQNMADLNLIVGENETLAITAFPANAMDKEITWNSSNTSIAAVDANGKVTALKTGTSTITATTDDGKHTAIYTVTVTDAAPPAKDGNKMPFLESWIAAIEKAISFFV